MVNKTADQKKICKNSKGAGEGTAGAYRIIPHTADTGLSIEAPSLEGLFFQAALGLFELLTGVSCGRSCFAGSGVVTLAAADLEGLFVDWLNELIYLLETEHQYTIASSLSVETAAPYRGQTEEKTNGKTEARADRGVRLRAETRSRPVSGGPSVTSEIKAATYHDLRIEKDTDDVWRATVILDL